jgi:hypothetical protein
MVGAELMYEMHILKNKKFFHLPEVSEMTSLALHPIIQGELDVNSALVKQSEGTEHFTNQTETSENIILIRLTDAQTHKAFLEKQIRCGAIKIMHHQSKIPLNVDPEDMPSSADLFELYIISQAEFVNFARLLSIDVVIDLENDQTVPAKQSTKERNREWQLLAEKFAQQYADAKKSKLTKRKAAEMISKLPQFKRFTAGNILRILKKTW